MEYTTITRKYALIPEFSDKKEWHKKVFDFTITNLSEKIEYYSGKIKKEKDSKKKEQTETKINSFKEQLEYIQNGSGFTQKMVNDYTYNLVRTAMEEESRRKNYILSWIFFGNEIEQSRSDGIVKGQIQIHLRYYQLCLS